MGFSPSAGNSYSLNGGSDVALNNPITNNVLSYDSAIQKWKNGPLTGYAKVNEAGQVVDGNNLPVLPMYKFVADERAGISARTEEAATSQYHNTFINNAIALAISSGVRKVIIPQLDPTDPTKPWTLAPDTQIDIRAEHAGIEIDATRAIIQLTDFQRPAFAVWPGADYVTIQFKLITGALINGKRPKAGDYDPDPGTRVDQKGVTGLRNGSRTTRGNNSAIISNASFGTFTGSGSNFRSLIILNNWDGIENRTATSRLTRSVGNRVDFYCEEVDFGLLYRNQEGLDWKARGKIKATEDSVDAPHLVYGTAAGLGSIGTHGEGSCWDSPDVVAFILKGQNGFTAGTLAAHNCAAILHTTEQMGPLTIGVLSGTQMTAHGIPQIDDYSDPTNTTKNPNLVYTAITSGFQDGPSPDGNRIPNAGQSSKHIGMIRISLADGIELQTPESVSLKTASTKVANPTPPGNIQSITFTVASKASWVVGTRLRIGLEFISIKTISGSEGNYIITTNEPTTTDYPIGMQVFTQQKLAVKDLRVINVQDDVDIDHIYIKYNSDDMSDAQSLIKVNGDRSTLGSIRIRNGGTGGVQGLRYTSNTGGHYLTTAPWMKGVSNGIVIENNISVSQFTIDESIISPITSDYSPLVRGSIGDVIYRGPAGESMVKQVNRYFVRPAGATSPMTLTKNRMYLYPFQVSRDLPQKRFGMNVISTGPSTTLTATANAGSNSLTVSDGTKVTSGSKIVIDSELATITSVSGSTVTLSASLSVTHSNGQSVQPQGAIRLGIYADNGSGLPGKLMFDVGDGGSGLPSDSRILDARPGTIPAASLASVITLTPGFYWQAVVAQIADVTVASVASGDESTPSLSMASAISGSIPYMDAIAGSLPTIVTISGDSNIGSPRVGYQSFNYYD